MKFSPKIQKNISLVILSSIIFSLSPLLILRTQANVVGPAANTAVATPISTAGAAINAVCTPLTVGNGLVCDPGVRFNTYQILLSTIGVGPGVAQRQTYWNAIFYFAMRILLRELTMGIVNWINTGFQGNPSFLQDPAQFLKNDIDRTIGNFIQSSDLGFLCDPFKINVKLSLGLQYSPFKDTIGCRLTDVLKNSEDAYNNFVNGDFIGGGGWESWLSITTVPQNNQLGAMLIAQSELDARINDQSVLRGNELNWGGGLLSMKECTRTTRDKNGAVVGTPQKYKGDPGFNIVSDPVGTTVSASSSARYEGDEWTGSVSETCQIVTPGTMISDQMKNATGWDTDALNMADDINEIVGALANFVITKAINTGFSLIKKEELSPNNSSWRDGLAQMQSQIAGDMSNITSNPSYNPDPNTYTSNPMNNNGGITSAGNNISSGAYESRESILSRIDSVLPVEQKYFNEYKSTYDLASSTLNKYNSIIDCYRNKLAATSIVLTNSEKNLANSNIDKASTTIRQINLTLAPTTTNLAGSQNNLTALKNISDTAKYAPTTEILNAASLNLTALMGVLHKEADYRSAEKFASTTNNQIYPLITEADSLQNQCNLFPNR